MATELTTQITGAAIPVSRGERSPVVREMSHKSEHPTQTRQSTDSKATSPHGASSEGIVESSKKKDDHPVNMEELEQAVQKVNNLPQLVSRDLMFIVDEDSGSTVVKVVNADTEELIRQIPSEEALQISKHMDDVGGLIFRSKA